MIPFIDWVYLLYFLTNLKKLPHPSPLSCSLLPSIFSRNACFHVLQLCWKTEKKKEKKRPESWVEQQIWPTRNNHKTFPDSERGKCRLVSLGTEASILKLKFTFQNHLGQAACLAWRPNLSKQESVRSGSYSDRWLPGHQRNAVLLFLIQQVAGMRKCGHGDYTPSPFGQNCQYSDAETQF